MTRDEKIQSMAALAQSMQQEQQQICRMDNENQLNDGERQAIELLNWSDGIGTLEGCDLRFKINQLGCLELLDSDDESQEIQQKYAQQLQQQQQQAQQQQRQQQQRFQKSDNGNSNHNISNINKRKTSATKIKHIQPGVSLLRDGPLGHKRAKSSLQMPSSRELHQREISNALLLEKLIARERLSEIKTNLHKWTVLDVKSFIDTIPGCSGLGRLFESQQICGESLTYLDQKDLLEIIKIKLGPAIKIHNIISILKS